MKRWAIVRQAAMVGVCSIAGSLFARSAVPEWKAFAAEPIVRQINPGPPAAARFYAVLNTCIYDAWAAYDPIAVGTCTGDSLQVPASENTESMKKEAVNHAAYAALLN